MRRLTRVGCWLSAVLLCGMVGPAGMADDDARTSPMLDIMSMDPKECSLELSYPWGGIVGTRVYFNDHEGPFAVAVEPSGKGVRVNFTGWGKGPFAASAEKIRITYRTSRGKTVEFTAEAMPAGEVRVRITGRPVIHGGRIAFRLGERDVEGIAKLSIEASKK